MPSTRSGSRPGGCRSGCRPRPSRSPVDVRPTSCVRPIWPTWLGPPSSAPSCSTRGRSAGPMCTHRTIACAYSLRANTRATVSTPVTWDELTQVEPNDFTLDTVRARIATTDPFATIDDVAHDLTPLLEWAARDDRDGDGDLPYPPD